jgi:hypothetical protein
VLTNDNFIGRQLPRPSVIQGTVSNPGDTSVQPARDAPCAQPSGYDQGPSYDNLFVEEVTHDAEDVQGHHAPSQEESGDDSTAPTGVVKVYLASLKEKISHEMQGGSLPKCYQNGQFWVHPPHPYFAMHKSAQRPGGLEPYTLYHPSVFLWLPHLLDKSGYALSIFLSH